MALYTQCKGTKTYFCMAEKKRYNDYTQNIKKFSHPGFVQPCLSQPTVLSVTHLMSSKMDSVFAFFA
jgi:hypothetical protein